MWSAFPKCKEVPGAAAAKLLRCLGFAMKQAGPARAGTLSERKRVNMLQMKSRAHNVVARVRAGAVASVLAASLIASAGAFAGCAANGGVSQDQAAQEAVTAITSTLDADAATAESLFDLIAFYPQDYGVASDVFAAWYFDGANCQPVATDVQGDAATVTVTFNAKRMADVLPVMEHARDAAIEAGANAMQEGYANAQFEAAAANAQVATEARQVSVALAKDADGTWAISDKATLAAALLDGYDPRQIDAN